MEKVEILAPAGNMECFLAAINAGADAVYMAGKNFGARASANNFTEEEFIEALNIAHIHGRRIYLTLNTLIKEREWKDLYSFLKPLYEAGLDGVIIQDLGLIDYLSRQFPGLPLHASTQMTVTDYRSAALLKSRGICRVVPARELSLKEIDILKKKTGLEIETFIHGALCYCYSGQCLFSSYLGGRSGNRGRCAGPCRLPYEVNSHDRNVKAIREYPLSLKDLCTIEHVRELIEAGIDSFKIEGRMKSAEYVAGVTSIYRKYVDAYYAGVSTRVTSEDINTLKSLYLRSSIGSGYYYKHNGADMISLEDPSYNNQDQNVVKAVHDEIIQKTAVRKLFCNAYIHVGQEMQLAIWDEDGNSILKKGAVVEEAKSRAAISEDIEKQLNKTGGTAYLFAEIGVDLGDNCFVPVSLINELRRDALAEYEKQLLGIYARSAPDRLEETGVSLAGGSDNRTEIGVSILKEDTFAVVSGYDVDSLYIPYDLFYMEKMSEKTIYDYRKKRPDCRIMLSLPRIIRNRDERYLLSLRGFLDKWLIRTDDNEASGNGIFDGLLVRNLEEAEYINELGYNTYVELDYTLYGWNRHSQSFLADFGDRLTAPLELSLHELRELDNTDMVVPLYGYVPLMVAANCLAGTYGNCSGNKYGFDYNLRDRYCKIEPVFINCCHCYNEIYNSVPTSLHKKYDELHGLGFRHFRLDFTRENSRECERVMDYYFAGATDLAPADEFTSGHIDKGAI